MKPEADDVRNFCQKLIDNLNAYLEDFSKLNNIKELRPSARQQMEYNAYHQRLMEDIMKKPSKNTFLDLLFPNKKILLYGHKVISRVELSENEHKRLVMPLESFSTSVEYPRLGYLTPHTFHYHLITLKKEGLTDEANS